MSQEPMGPPPMSQDPGAPAPPAQGGFDAPAPGAPDAPPRAFRLSLLQVMSFVLLTQRRVRTMTGSVEELTAFAKKVLIMNLLLGWWGIPFGLIWTPMALYRNSKALGQLRQLAASGQVSPGWYPDPTGRHGARYWDGTTWTERVTDAGSDPLTGQASPPPA